jgi:hypothetical protein
MSMKEKPKTAGMDEAGAPRNMSIYRTEGVYQRLCLCEYLRDLPENPVVEAEETNRTASSSPSRHFPVGR